MHRESSATRRCIHDAAESLLSTRSSVDLRIVDVAHDANVAVQTIYYHFGSFGRLIAEAQMSAYLRMAEPSRNCLAAAEVAVSEVNEENLKKAVGDLVEHLWSFTCGGDEWGISKLLIDIWSEPPVRSRFCEVLDKQLEGWINVIEDGKRRGWFDAELDAPILVASWWAASHGRALLSNTANIRASAKDVRVFWCKIAKTLP
jgi:AcrR family transcriptional regulator